MATIWQTLLKVDTISIHDNFFELGGHSLLAGQIGVTDSEKEFNVKLALRDIFEQSTIAQMAELIANTQAEDELVPIPLVDRNQPLPVSFAQQRLLIIDQLEPDQATYNIPLVFQNERPFTFARLPKSSRYSLYTPRNPTHPLWLH